MCYECETWKPNIVNYDDKWFCGESCVEDYKSRERNRMQQEVEEIDTKIQELQYRKSILLDKLGERPYSWPRREQAKG